MMDALRFIFSSFWIWLGFTALIAVVLNYLVDAIKAIRNTRNVKIYNFEDGKRTVEIENATSKDVADALGSCNLDGDDITEGR